MKTTETIRADIFIIPNASYRYEGSMSQRLGLDGEFVQKLSNFWFSLPDEIREHREFKDEDWVQIWYATPNNSDHNSNWVDRTIDGYKELENWKPMISYLPKILFEGKKEGDCVTVDLPIVRRYELDESKDLIGIEDVHVHATSKIKVQLQLAQSKYRYARFGNFEEVLAKV